MNKEKELKEIQNVKYGGYVYVLKDCEGNTKIGKTRNPYQRVKDIENSCGRNIIDWFFSQPCKNYSQIESDLLKYFKKYQVKSEWFSCSYNDVLKKVKTMKFESIEDQYERELRQQVKINALIEWALNMQYKEYSELRLQYNLDNWYPTIEEIDMSLADIEENIEYNNSIGEYDFNTSLYNYANIIKNDKLSIESKKAIQDYYQDIIFAIDCPEMISNIFGEKYQFVKTVLGIKETICNPFVEKVMKENPLFNKSILS
jgi:hypothetical protein